MYPIFPVVYDLDENNEAITVHYFCSEKCRKEIKYSYEQEGSSDSYLDDTQCETCGKSLRTSFQTTCKILK